MKTYAVVLAHREGTAPERLASDRRYTPVDESREAWETATQEAQQEADAWTRRHGHSPLDCDQFGYFAVVDWADRPTYPARVRAKQR